jgi:vacuolar protein sorting-associated protein 13A/C
MLHTVLEIHMEHNATKILDENCRNIIALSAEDMKCSAKIYGEMKIIDFKLGSYQVSSPEGLLAEVQHQI